MRKRILFLFTGGTLWMRPAEGEAGARGVVTLDPGATLEEAELRAEVPSLERFVDYDVHRLFHLDSADFAPSHWLEVARAVHEALAGDVYDGVVVGHGTDTMAYTASAVALLLGPIPRPVVFTGAQRPLVDARTDGRENLVDAATVATLDVPEVSIVFGSEAFRGVRAVKRDARGFSAFDSPSCPPLVRLGLDLERAAHVRAAGALAPLDDRLEPRVLAVRLFPGLDPALLLGAVRVGMRGLVLEAYGTGTVPTTDGGLPAAVREITAAGVPVVVVSQCLRGFVDFARYPAGRALEAAGAIGGGDMTTECALAKLMIGLGRGFEGAALKAFVERDVAGERAL